MFAATRTPIKKPVEENKLVDLTERTGSASSKVRTSIDEWESGRISPILLTPPAQELTQKTLTTSSQVAPSTLRSKPSQPTQKITKTRKQTTEVPKVKSSSTNTIAAKAKIDQKTRVMEAEACLESAKYHLNSSRNTKLEIRDEVFAALDRLYQIVEEAEAEIKELKKGKTKGEEKEKSTQIYEHPKAPEHEDLQKRMEKHCRLIQENNKIMQELKEKMDTHHATLEKMTYANVLAGSNREKPPLQTAMHSVVVTSSDEMETGEEVIERVRKAVNARDGGIVVDKIRKAKDRKVIVGCKDRTELEKVQERIKEKGEKLTVQEIKNKDPLVVLLGVLKSNSDEDILKAMKVQNKHLLKEVAQEENRMEVRYRRRARNPHTTHVVMRVSPQIWKKLTNAGAVHIDMQRVRVADQSPLIQCSRCLGYGHGKRFCHDTVDICSHCGGQHLRAECPEWLAEATPSCVNCTKSKMERNDHNAFSSECPVRRKWESLARSTVAYC